MRPLVEGHGTSLILYEIAGGTRFEPHRHDFPEFGVALEGRAILIIEGKEHELRAGSSVFVPPDCAHGLVVPDGPTPLVLLDVCTSPAGTGARALTPEVTRFTARVARPSS